VGAGTLYVLRLLTRRWREEEDAGEDDVPYGPSRAREASASERSG
jgi:cytochrome bd ubiquinol oxidase subunit I